MQADDEYGRQLGAQLRREIEGVHAAADLAQTVHHRQVRRTWAIRTAIATPVAVAAAAIVFLNTIGAAGPTQVESAGPAQVENVAFVQAQTIKALSHASDYVIYAKATYNNGYYEMWTDKATHRYRYDVYQRTPIGDFGSVSGTSTAVAPPAPGELTLGPIHLFQSHLVTGQWGDRTVVYVDYELRCWSTSHVTDTRHPSVVPDITDADSIQQAIASGTLELLGHERIAGLDKLHLRMFGPNRSYRIDMWVDSATYLPVREVAVKRYQNAGTDEFPADLAVTTTYSWLPRTGENLAHLVLTPPVGFVKK